MEVDPAGLLSLGMKETWSDVSSFPRGTHPQALGLTQGWIEGVNCRCENSGCGWTLGECAALLHIVVRVLDGVWGPQERFVRKAESQHVDDFRAGLPTIRATGEAAEAAVRRQTFSSKEMCEAHGQAAVRKALWAATNGVAQQSGRKYDQGRHTWRWPYWLSQ
jgi:hypothetical protein